MGATNNRILAGALALAAVLPLLTAAAPPAGKSGTPVEFEFEFEGGIEIKDGASIGRNARITYKDMVLRAAEARTTDSFDNGNASFHGGVQIDSPRGKLRAQDANLVVRDGRVISAVLTGTAAEPATFEQTAQPSQPEAKGRARTIEYDPAAETVHLKTGVWFSRAINNAPSELTGESFLYNIATGDLKGGATRGRVKMTVHPKPKTEEKAPAP